MVMIMSRAPSELALAGACAPARAVTYIGETTKVSVPV